MDIWQSGREELFDELAKVCDRFGASLAAELDPVNSALIPRDKLRFLREKAAKVDELEDDVSSLVRQKRALEARLSDVEVLQDRSEENYQLIETNERLEKELESQRAASSRVDGLEKENKHLAAELEQALQQIQDGEKTAGDKGLMSTPTPATLSEPSSSVLRGVGDESRVVPKENYTSMVRKFNALFEKHADGKAYRERLEKLLTGEKEKSTKYKEYTDYLEKKIKKREAKIEEQDGKLRRVRTQIGDVSGESRLSQGLEMTPRSTRQEREKRNLEEVSIALNSASLGSINYGGKVTSFDDIIKALNSPMLNEIVVAAQRMRAATSCPVEGGHREILSPSPEVRTSTARPIQRRVLSQTIDFLSSDSVGISEVPRENLFGRNIVLQLPTILPGGDHVNDKTAIETEFEALQTISTSPADRSTSCASPKKPAVPEIKEEPVTDTPILPDAPIVISSRSVKKRKGHSDESQLHEVSRIKVEILSSSPIGLAAVYGLDESIDLDDIGEKQVTPRKGRPYLQRALRTSSSLAIAARSESQSENQSGSSHPNNIGHISQETLIPRNGATRKGPALQPRNPNTILPRTSTERAPKRRRVASDKAVEDLIEDGQVIQSVEKSPRSTSRQTRLLGELLAKASPPKQVLRTPARLTPLQLNSHQLGGRASAVSSRAYEVPRNNTPLQETFGPGTPAVYSTNLKAKIFVEPSRPASRSTMGAAVEASRSSSKGSTRNSLEPLSREIFRDSAYFSRPTSRDSPVGYLEASKPSKASPRTPAETVRPFSRHSLKGSIEPERPSSKGTNPKLKLPGTVPKPAQSRQRERNATPGSRTGKQALRTRPLNELTLYDFKVNPKYNQGYDYAFDTVVRKQADRRCLQGCTKPECCGEQFRVLAEATRNPNKPLTMSQEEADDKILKEFLGDNSYKLRNMTKAEREEILVQALTRNMSNKHGKHRHAYERPASPPGYWRSDFPTTQEEVQDRAKAEEMERNQVAQRYEAAMRPGGAYVFRDE